MPTPTASPLLQTFVDDEMLRAPLLFEQVLEGTHEAIRRALPSMNPLQRSALADVQQAMLRQRVSLGEYFMRSLREQVQAELSKRTPQNAAAPARMAPVRASSLSLVDEEQVSVEVELSHAIQAVKNAAEYELRELQTYVAALVGDLTVAGDHNPFRAETWVRATWAAAQALPLSRSHQIAFMRQASEPLAQQLRVAYASATSRLESLGVEPAAYRTMILPSGSRRGGRTPETTYAPDLARLSETLPAPLDGAPATRASDREHWTEVARGVVNRADRQAVELISRLFDAIAQDKRVPADVQWMIARLQGPAMRLSLLDRSLLDQHRHPLWHFINGFVFAAEMVPDEHDPERLQLLKLAQTTIEQIASEPSPSSSLYRWALERLSVFLDKRLARRLAAQASQVGALQKLESRVVQEAAPPSTTSGALDHHQLDTVPAEFMDTVPPAADDEAERWMRTLRAGDWVRMYFQGRWRQAQLLWLGHSREFLLFGDGGSDETWAMRSGALRMLHGHHLAKTLKVRSIVGSAAARVHEQLSAAMAPARVG